MEKKSFSQVNALLSELDLPFGRVLDVGGWDVNGSFRGLFDAYDYMSLDIKHGKDIDIVADAHKLPFKDNSFIMVMCVETLQYVVNPFKVVAEIHRVLQPGGVACLTTSFKASVGLIGSHWPDKRPWLQDSFRYLPKGMHSLLDEAGFIDIIRCELPKNMVCWGVARK